MSSSGHWRGGKSGGAFSKGLKGRIGSSGSSEPKSRFTPYSSTKKKSSTISLHPNLPTNHLIQVNVTGWQGGNQDALLALLSKVVDQKKSKKQGNITIKVQNISYNQDEMIFKVENLAQAKLLSLANGTKFNGQKLNFTIQKGNKIIPALTQFVKSRWNPQLKLADLSNMQQDEDLIHAGIGEGLGEETGKKGATTADKLGAVICKLLHQECQGLTSLRLDRCNLKSFSPLQNLFAENPTLQNLSVAWNKISTLDNLLPLRGAPLRELILLGNPVRERDVANRAKRMGTVGGDASVSESVQFRQNVVSIFPQLQILDDLPIGQEMEDDDTMIQVGNQPKKTIVAGIPLMAGFVDGEETGSIVKDFCQRFFPMFDGNRPLLGPLYHPTHSRFSLTVSTKVPPQRPPHVKGGRGDDLTAWFKWNKNLSRYAKTDQALTSIVGQGPVNTSSKGGGSSGDRRITHTFEGSENILQCLTQLPSTRFPSLEAMQTRFVMDAWQITLPPSMDSLFLTIHGDFIESSINLCKSFDMTVLLIPSPVGSLAQVNGWPYQCLNMEMFVRPWSGNNAWKFSTPQNVPHGIQLMEQQEVGQGGQVEMFPWLNRQTGDVDLSKLLQGVVRDVVQRQDVAQITTIRGQASVDDQKHTLVLHFQSLTNLNYPFAVQCLSESGWDMKRAVTMFGASKTMVPSEAFLEGGVASSFI